MLRETRDNRLYSLYVLALYLGLRREELFGRRWMDVDPEGVSLEIRTVLQRVDGTLTLTAHESWSVIAIPPGPGLFDPGGYAHVTLGCPAQWAFTGKLISGEGGARSAREGQTLPCRTIAVAARASVHRVHHPAVRGQRPTAMPWPRGG